MKSTLTLITLTTLLLMGCGGGGGDSTPAPPTPEQPGTPEQPETPDDTTKEDNDSTTTLVAGRDFDFRIDEEVTLHLTPPSSDKGSFNLYWQVAFEDTDSGLVAADPASRIASLPHSAQSYTLTVNRNWQELLVEWQPQTGQAPQQMLRLPLSGNRDYQVQFN